jgi:hypothetical protein
MVEQIFPKVNFDWLGELPSLMDEARTRQARSTLGNFDLNTDKGISAAANELLKRGDFAGATELMKQATARKTAQAAETSAAQRGADIALWQKFMADQQKKGGPSIDTEAPVSFGPAKPVPAPSMPSWMQNVPGAGAAAESPVKLAGDVLPLPIRPGPQAGMPNAAERIQGTGNPAVPMIIPQTPQGYDNLNRQYNAMPPGPRGAEVRPTPSDEVLMAAEGAPKAPPTQLAGPPPVPDTSSPPAGPPPQMAPTAPVPFAAPPAPTAAPPSVPPPGAPGGMPMVSPDQVAAQGNMVKVGNEVMMMPPRAQGMPVFQTFMARFKNEMAKQKLSQETQDYHLDQAQRVWRGQDVQSRAEWKTDIAIRPEYIKQALKSNQEFEEMGNKQEKVLNILNRMDQISSDKDFVSGKGTGRYAQFMSWLGAMGGVLGVDFQSMPGYQEMKNAVSGPFQNHMKAAQLAQQFQALANRAVLENAGSLSKGFSEGDRVFMSQVFPSLDMSPGAIKSIIEDLRATANHAVGLSKATRKYMSESEGRAKATPWGLQDASDAYNEAHPLFVDKNSPDGLTDRGRKLKALSMAGPTPDVRSLQWPDVVGGALKSVPAFPSGPGPAPSPLGAGPSPPPAPGFVPYQPPTPPGARRRYMNRPGNEEE